MKIDDMDHSLGDRTISFRCSKTNETLKSADYETAISKVGFGRFNYIVLAVSLVASSVGPMATSTISFILPVATCDLELSPYQKGILTVSPLFGMTLSGFAWGHLSDTMGRKRLMNIAFVLDTAVVIAASLSASFWQLAIFKFLDGLIICGPQSIFMAYLSEVFSSDRRKLVVLSTGLFVSMGNVLQAVVAWLLIPGQSQYDLFGLIPLKSWRLFLLVCSLPPFLCSIGSFIFIESPKFLLDKGRKEEALNALKKMYSINTGLPASSYPVHYLMDSNITHDVDNNLMPSLKNKVMAGLKDAFTVFRPPYGLRILQFCFLQLSAMLGMNIVRLWLPQLLADRDSNSNGTAGQTLCESISKPVETLDMIAYCEHLVINSSIFVNMIFLCSSYILSQTIFISTVSFVGKKHYATLMLCMVTVAFAAFPNIPAGYIMAPSLFVAGGLNVTYFCLLGTIVEVFPTSVRATSVSTIVTVARLASVICNMFTSTLLYTHCAYLYYTLGALVGVAFVGSFFMPTKPIVEDEGGSTSESEGKHIENITGL